MASDALDRFEQLFTTDDAAELLATSDELSDRLVDIVEMGLDVIEQILVDGQDDTRIAALQKILPLATKVAERRGDAALKHLHSTMRDMMYEVFPDRTALEGPGIVE